LAVSYQSDELKRLRRYAEEQWQLSGHVLPYEQAAETLHESVRATALDYFKRHEIKWWTSKWDARTKEMEPRPTGHLNSSQVACVNHLEPARIDARVAQQVISNVDESLAPVRVDDGYVDYEWIGRGDYLGERGSRTRGANITSLDALMCGERDGQRILLVFEWKYLEAYGPDPVATSRRGTDRIATYMPLLDDSECPIVLGAHGRLFYEPYYQLMRQTLLAWQMVKHKEFRASDWLHIHVVPELNLALRRRGKGAPELAGASMAEAWRSVLKRPEGYRLMTPHELLVGVGRHGRWADWRSWLGERYLT
jgi:hypothetical protein